MSSSYQAKCDNKLAHSHSDTVDTGILSQGTCSICLTELCQVSNIKKTVCNHSFCEICLNAWLKINNTCPLCRTIITQYPEPKPNMPTVTFSRNGDLINRTYVTIQLV